MVSAAKWAFMITPLSLVPAVMMVVWDGVIEDSGIVFIYQYIDVVWKEVARLSASDSQAGDAFGQGIAAERHLGSWRAEG